MVLELRPRQSRALVDPISDDEDSFDDVLPLQKTKCNIKYLDKFRSVRRVRALLRPGPLWGHSVGKPRFQNASPPDSTGVRPTRLIDVSQSHNQV